MGTWVNYTPVSQEGVNVEDGDLIHIGRVGFRFRVRQSSPNIRPA
jgi:pSer/pThr/pTyr-binding forkhead associated (FHA) protein